MDSSQLESKMKKTISTLLLTLVTAANFAEEATSHFSVPQQISIEPKAPPTITPEEAKNWFLYLKMAMADSQPSHIADFVPGVGLGFRMTQGKHGLDISSNGAYGKGWNNEIKTHFWTFPRVSYLHYFNPTSNQSLYFGGGLGWGEIRTRKESQFLGIIPSLTLGMEMLRTSAFLTFTELNISQAAVARKATGPFPGPVAEFSVGAGF
jgi:hypothetical protein